VRLLGDWELKKNAFALRKFQRPFGAPVAAARL